MPHGVEPVTQWKAEIVGIQFDESLAQDWCMSQMQCKRVGFKLKMSTENGHTERQKLKHNQQQLILTRYLMSVITITKTKTPSKPIIKQKHEHLETLHNLLGGGNYTTFTWHQHTFNIAIT